MYRLTNRSSSLSRTQAQKMAPGPQQSEPEQSQNKPGDKGTTVHCKQDKKGGNSKKPKTPHPVEELLGHVLVNAEGQTTNPKCLLHDDGVIGLYFGAHWCPPCRALTPYMVHLYEEVKKAGHQIEMVFISFDHNMESFTNYFSKMPWWAVEYGQEEKREDIAFNFSIRGIPVLLFLDGKSLKVITTRGKDILLNDPEGQLFPWRDLPDPFTFVTPSAPSQSDTDKDSQLEEIPPTGEQDASNRAGISGEPQDDMNMAEGQQPGVSQKTADNTNDTEFGKDKENSREEPGPDNLPQDGQQETPDADT